MDIDPNVLKLIQSAGLTFFLQENDVVQLSIDKQLGSNAYLQPYSATLAGSATNTDGQYGIDDEGTSSASYRQFNIPDGEIWVLSKIAHVDIEPGIFTVEITIDGETLFPPTLMESAYFTLDLPKAQFCTKYLRCKVANGDTSTKTYRHLRLWQRYSRKALNAFLEKYGLPAVR